MSRSASASSAVAWLPGRAPALSASVSVAGLLITGILGRLPARDAAEHAADGHADAGRIAAPEHIPGHNLAGGEHVGRRTSVFHEHARFAVHPRRQIREGN